MNYAVIYQPISGNTQKIANTIYESLTTQNKVIRDMDRDLELPNADVYFVGFCCPGGVQSLVSTQGADVLKALLFAVPHPCHQMGQPVGVGAVGGFHGM